MLVSRPSHMRVREFLLTVPVTTRVRGTPSEVALGPQDGLLKPCVANASDIELTARTDMVRRIATLAALKQGALDDALRFALGLD